MTSDVTPDADSGIRRLCGAWGPADHPALPKDWPMPPCCNLDYEHDGPHRGSFGTEWTDLEVQE